MRASAFRSLRLILLAGVAAAALGACAMNRTNLAAVDLTTTGSTGAASMLVQTEQRYKAHPDDKRNVLYYAASLRAAGQPEQAVSVIETSITAHPKDIDLKVAYAKALTAAGRFDQALTVIEDAINPATPDWNALLVKGAVLDQMGRNEEARAIYQQASLTAPNEPSLEANLGLSYAMTNDLDQAKAHLKRAVSLPGATSQVRQNLALVIGLEGHFDDARAMFAKELPADQVEANMNYIRALLTQQNRWDLIKGAKSTG